MARVLSAIGAPVSHISPNSQKLGIPWQFGGAGAPPPITTANKYRRRRYGLRGDKPATSAYSGPVYWLEKLYPASINSRNHELSICSGDLTTT